MRNVYCLSSTIGFAQLKPLINSVISCMFIFYIFILFRAIDILSVSSGISNVFVLFKIAISVSSNAYIRQAKVKPPIFYYRPNFWYVFTHNMRVIFGQKDFLNITDLGCYTSAQPAWVKRLTQAGWADV